MCKKCMSQLTLSLDLLPSLHTTKRHSTALSASAVWDSWENTSYMEHQFLFSKLCHSHNRDLENLFLLN